MSPHPRVDMTEPTVDLLSEVEAVLAEAGTPLHYRVITQRVLERGRWRTAGKTPEATISARLSEDAKNRGAGSRFVRTGKGVVALRSWSPTQLGENDGSEPAIS